MSILIAQVVGGAIARFPIYEHEFRAMHPNVSFPLVITEVPEGFVIVEDTPRPEYDQITHKLVEELPILANGKGARNWAVIPNSDEEIASNRAAVAEQNLYEAKAARHLAVEQIVVTTGSGKEFNGNEDARNRMSTAVVSMDDDDVTDWVLANNTVASVTRAELKEALRLAGIETTAIWIKPYA